jgi:ACS family pantothenate transporter-like MFS transporter
MNSCHNTLTLRSFWNTTVGKVANTVAQLFLKNDPDHKWSLYEVNNIPTSINGFNIIMVLLLNTYIDTTGCRMRAVALNLSILLFGTICLVAWDIPLGLKIASYMFAGLDGPLSPIFYAWANILTTGDAQVRALTLAVMNSCGAALTTVIQQFLYPVTDAPKFGKGFKASLGFLIGMCGWVVVVRVFEMRALARKQAENGRIGSDETSEQGATAVGVIAESKV